MTSWFTELLNIIFFREKESISLLDKRKNLRNLYIAISYTPLQKPSQSVCAFGLTSWGFIVNYTHKRPLRGHCAPPLQKPSQSVCAFGLTSWGFIVKKAWRKAMPLHFPMLSPFWNAPHAATARKASWRDRCRPLPTFFPPGHCRAWTPRSHPYCHARRACSSAQSGASVGT